VGALALSPNYPSENFHHLRQRRFTVYFALCTRPFYPRVKKLGKN
jgi:hypothetical protein